MPRVVRCAKPSDMNSRAAIRVNFSSMRVNVAPAYLSNMQPKEKNNMRLRTSVIMVALTLFVVASSASATMPWQHKPEQPKRSEEHTSELQSLRHLVSRVLLE